MNGSDNMAGYTNRDIMEALRQISKQNTELMNAMVMLSEVQKNIAQSIDKLAKVTTIAAELTNGQR
jgi:hypothetical protein